MSVAETSIAGYHPPLRLDRTAQGGGVAVWVKEELSYEHLSTINCCNHALLWLAINLHGRKKLVVGALYRPGLCARPRHKLAGAPRRLPWTCPLSRFKHYPRWWLQRSQRVLDRQLENNSRRRISRRAVCCTRTPPARRDGHKVQEPTWPGPARFRRPSTCGAIWAPSETQTTVYC